MRYDDPSVFAPPVRAPQGRRPTRPRGRGFSWGGQLFGDPEEAVDWMNARGQDTSLEQFLGNHPGLAALFGQRQASPEPAPQAMPMRTAAPAGPPLHEALLSPQRQTRQSLLSLLRRARPRQ